MEVHAAEAIAFRMRGNMGKAWCGNAGPVDVRLGQPKHKAGLQEAHLPVEALGVNQYDEHIADVMLMQHLAHSQRFHLKAAHLHQGNKAGSHPCSLLISCSRHPFNHARITS